MCVRLGAYPIRVLLSLLSGASFFFCGCSQTEYRLQADREAYETIEERNEDPRWAAHKIDIDLDPRSRYFDPYDPDHSPMPLDDPTSQQYMHVVDDLEGWEHWHENGVRSELENPQWRTALGEYVETAEDGSVKLDINSALRLAYVHSPNHQRQLETLYLSALDVTEERFNLDTRFFGGYGLNFANSGKLAGNSSRLRSSGDLFAERRFSTAGELLVGFANSFVFEFSGGDTNLSQSLVNFAVTQPLLRGAGRDIALEGLTANERKLLANLRAYSQFRQGFYTNIAIGDLGVVGPSRGQTSTNLTSFGGNGGVNGYAGLLQQVQRIRNTEYNLKLQSHNLELLLAYYAAELTDIVQVDRLRQNIEKSRANLLDQTNQLQLAEDNYKIDQLGLPSDLSLDLDESLIAQFQLLPLDADPIVESLRQFQKRVGDIGELLALAESIEKLQATVLLLPGNADVDSVDAILRDSLTLVEFMQMRVDKLAADLETFELMNDPSEPPVSDADLALVEMVKEKIANGPKSLVSHYVAAAARLKRLSDGLTDESLETTVSGNVEWLSDLLKLSEGCVVIQHRTHRVDQDPKMILEDAFADIELVKRLFDNAHADLARMDTVVPVREKTMTEATKELFKRDRERLHQRMDDLEKSEVGFDVTVAKLESLRDGLTDETRVETNREVIAWAKAFLQVVERLSLVSAQARLEVITVDSIDLGPEAAFEVALENRLDFMNGRAALVDRWRRIQVTSDALQSNLTVTASGDINTARDNPVSLRPAAGNFRMGLQFDAPFTRLVERNAYRSSLITYQQSRREFIQSRDSLQKGLRALIRTLDQRRRQLEIQRLAVSIAIRRVDQTQLALNTPPPQLPPGMKPSINPTTAIDLLSAQSSLLDTQNAFLAAWLNYYAAKLRLYRELGVMQLDADGRWVETSLDDLGVSVPLNNEDTEALPPMIPPALYEAALQRESASDSTQAPGLIASVLDRIGIRKIARPQQDNEVRQVSAELASPEPNFAKSRASYAQPEQLPKSVSNQATICRPATRQSPMTQQTKRVPKLQRATSAEQFKQPATSNRSAKGRKRSKVSKDRPSTKGWVATKPEN